MQSKKKTLIDLLNGSLVPFKDLPEKIAAETIYDEAGIVDIEFFSAILQYMELSSSIQDRIMAALGRLLGCDEDESPKTTKKDNGAKWSVEEILKRCTLEDNILKLPAVTLNKKSYDEAKKWITEAGGSWVGGKTQGFSFPFNPERVFSILHEGKRCNLTQQFQFFETPDGVADWLVSLVGSIDDNDAVLEPSAGRGAIVRAIHRAYPRQIVDCYELMPENREILKKMGGINFLGKDFIASPPAPLYDKIIANPPFASNQDITHLQAMYKRLAPGGTLGAIMSNHWQFAEEKVCVDFREWLHKHSAQTFSIDEGAFKDSGTNIRTTAVVLTKKL